MKRGRSRWDVGPDYSSDASEQSNVVDESDVEDSEREPKRRRVMTSEEEQQGNDGSNSTEGISIDGVGQLTMEEYETLKWQAEMAERNGPLTDEELDELFPLEGYQILEPPADYKPEIKRQNYSMSKKLQYYSIPENIPKDQFGVQAQMDEIEPSLPQLKPDDLKVFGSLLQKGVDEDSMTKREKRERELLKLLLKIKNGNPIQRKHSLKYLTRNAKIFGGKMLFRHILPLLMSPTLEDQERHYLIKVVDRIIFKLEEEVRPFAHKILVVVEPLLIDEDYLARIEGREIIANLAKACGLPTMLNIMRTDISSPDEYVRNTTARTFAVVAQALGIRRMLPFLDAVCRSTKNWEARHTGIKVFQQIAATAGCSILPHLARMVQIIKGGLQDEQIKVRVMTALALAQMAEAAFPYGIEAFDPCLRSLFFGCSTAKGKSLSAFLQALGAIIPLMGDELAANYARNILPVLLREFYTHDDAMRSTVLRVLEHCLPKLPAKEVRQKVLPDFMECFWKPALALSRRNCRLVVGTSVALAKVVGVDTMVERLVHKLKHPSEPFRRMVMETLFKILDELGCLSLDARLQKLLIDGGLFAFQKLTDNGRFSQFCLRNYGGILKILGARCKNYLPLLGGAIKHRLINQNPVVRQQAGDLLVHLAPVIKTCGDEGMLRHLAVVLYESLGEEYPDVLGSIIGGLKAVVEQTSLQELTPPVRDLLPRLTPILKNRHEGVQQNTIDLVGRIANKGAELVPAKEWMRISFELLELLKAQRKTIRRSAINTFGYIARAIGPQEVISTLLSNLRVQERKLRVCTTIAIAIVGETCSPFTVLPALMNEYKVPEMNVQNGVLKALNFLFEYIGEMGADYLYAVVPLLEDALSDRDPVHRQIACTVVKHLAINTYGRGFEDALSHLLNFVWPNIMENANVHYMRAVIEAIDGLRVGLGPMVILMHCMTGLFHPARRIRNIYWRIYNETYIYGADAMVPALPNLKTDSEENNYNRDELDLFI